MRPTWEPFRRIMALKTAHAHSLEETHRVLLPSANTAQDGAPLISPLGDIQPDSDQLSPTNADSVSAKNYVYDATLTLSDIGSHLANETLNQ